MKLATRHPDLGTLLPIYLAPDDGNPPAGGLSSPEDRLAIAERDLAATRAELASAQAEAAALKGAVETVRAAEAKRRAAEVSGYLLGLKKQAAPNAIPEGDLARVQALFDAGRDEDARFVGDLLLKGAQPAERGTQIDLAQGATKDPQIDPQIESDAVIAEALRSQGWKVEQDSKGRITGKTPPQKAGR